ncbi:MAG TPA: hypothetical protein VK633_14245 [Verrucomicrobiae bacterium]|nr:hypothetical protein [Verrucomicrobiae bacterium]
MVAWLFSDIGLEDETMPLMPSRLTPILLLAAALPGLGRADEVGDLKLSLWERTVNLRGAFGYKDNVLLSHTQREASPFWQSALDFSLIRAALDDGPSVTFFLTGEDRRYFSSSEVEKEQLILSQAKFTQEISSEWALGGLAQYLYADQVFDASATEQFIQALKVKSHNIQFAPFVTRSLPGKMELELKFTGERQLFNEPLDDYWEIGPQLTWTKQYGHRSSAALSYTYDDRRYDTRRQLDLAFQPVENSSLRFDQHEFEGVINHSWDARRRWRSRARFLFEVNQDNGSGYYDYYRYRFSQRFGYYSKSWQATVEGKVLHYDYQRQPVPGTAELRQVWEYVAGLHLEKTIWNQLKIFADTEHEIVKSNYQVEEYWVNTLMGGVDWEF